MFSTARRKRNHMLKLIRRASTHEIPPRSKTTTPHPPLCKSRSVVLSACSSRFHGFVRLVSCSTACVEEFSCSDGKDRGGRMPRRGASLSLSTCSPAQRATWIRVDSANAVCFPTRPGMALSTPRISSRGCRQPCICIDFLLAASRLRALPISLPAEAKYEELSRSGCWSPICPHRIQSSRGSSTPAAASEIGSRESETSTNTHASCRSVACASKEKARLVRPEEAGPHNSTRDPRGKPPPSTSSSSATPLGWSSTTERFWNPSRPRPTKASYLPGFREGVIIGVFCIRFLFAYALWFPVGGKKSSPRASTGGIKSWRVHSVANEVAGRRLLRHGHVRRFRGVSVARRRRAAG